jgi:hypothetical protein
VSVKLVSLEEALEIVVAVVSGSDLALAIICGSDIAVPKNDAADSWHTIYSRIQSSGFILGDGYGRG